MASKLSRLQARIKNMQGKAERGAMAVLHTGESLGATALTGFLMGRLSNADGDWNVRKVPVPLLASGALLLTGLFAGAKSQEHIMALGTGVASPWVGIKSYEYGLEMKNKQKKTAGQRRPPMMGQGSAFSNQPATQTRDTSQVKLGTAFDGVKQ